MDNGNREKRITHVNQMFKEFDRIPQRIKYVG